MLKKEKIELVNHLKQELEDAVCLYLFEFSGVTVNEDNALRMKIKETGATYRVIKNRLLKKATEGTRFEEATKNLVRNTVVAYTKEDPVSLAKVLSEFAKEKDTFFFKGGVLEETVLTPDMFEEIATLPSKEELVAKLMYLLNYPLQGLVTALQGIYRNLPVVLNQIAKQKEEN